MHRPPDPRLKSPTPKGAWLVLSLLLGACVQDASRDPVAAGPAVPRHVELQLNWYPEAEHGGYFAALVHGYYAEAGLDVTIRPGGTSVPVVSLVASKRATFGVASADTLLLGWPQEARTVAILAPLQHSPRCIMVHERTGIRDWPDLHDVTLAMNASSTFSLFLQRKLPLTNVKIVPYSGNVSQFLLNRDFTQQAFVFSEPYVARKQGGDPHCLMVSDLGFDPYTSVLLTHPDTIASEPELVRKMVRASVRGWRKYLEDSQATNRYISQQNHDMDVDILEYGAAQLRPLCVEQANPTDAFGRMTLERWQTLADQLVETHSLEPGAVDPRAVFATQFAQADQAPEEDH